jgi:hypothetical protein
LKTIDDDDVTTVSRRELIRYEADRIRYRWLAEKFAEANDISLEEGAIIIDAAIREDMQQRDSLAERRAKKKGSAV